MQRAAAAHVKRARDATGRSALVAQPRRHNHYGSYVGAPNQHFMAFNPETGVGIERAGLSRFGLKKTWKPKWQEHAQNPLHSLLRMEASGGARLIQMNSAVAFGDDAKSNRLTISLVRALTQVLRQYETNPAVTMVILRGVEDGVFSSGADAAALKAAATSDPRGAAAAVEYMREVSELAHLIGSYAKPIVTGMHGLTLGAGLGLAAAARFSYIVKGSVIGSPEILHGLLPTAGASYHLARLPDGLGMYMALTGAVIRGEEAYWAGLAPLYGIPGEATMNAGSGLERGVAAVATSHGHLPWSTSIFRSASELSSSSLTAIGSLARDPVYAESLRQLREYRSDAKLLHVTDNMDEDVSRELFEQYLKLKRWYNYVAVGDRQSAFESLEGDAVGEELEEGEGDYFDFWQPQEYNGRDILAEPEFAAAERRGHIAAIAGHSNAITGGHLDAGAPPGFLSKMRLVKDVFAGQPHRGDPVLTTAHDVTPPLRARSAVLEDLRAIRDVYRTRGAEAANAETRKRFPKAALSPYNALFDGYERSPAALAAFGRRGIVSALHAAQERAHIPETPAESDKLVKAITFGVKRVWPTGHVHGSLLDEVMAHIDAGNVVTDVMKAAKREVVDPVTGAVTVKDLDSNRLKIPPMSLDRPETRDLVARAVGIATARLLGEHHNHLSSVHVLEDPAIERARLETIVAAHRGRYIGTSLIGQAPRDPQFTQRPEVGSPEYNASIIAIEAARPDSDAHEIDATLRRLLNTDNSHSYDESIEGFDFTTHTDLATDVEGHFYEPKDDHVTVPIETAAESPTYGHPLEPVMGDGRDIHPDPDAFLDAVAGTGARNGFIGHSPHDYRVAAKHGINGAPNALTLVDDLRGELTRLLGGLSLGDKAPEKSAAGGTGTPEAQRMAAAVQAALAGADAAARAKAAAQAQADDVSGPGYYLKLLQAAAVGADKRLEASMTSRAGGVRVGDETVAAESIATMRRCLREMHVHLVAGLFRSIGRHVLNLGVVGRVNFGPAVEAKIHAAYPGLPVEAVAMALVGEVIDRTTATIDASWAAGIGSWHPILGGGGMTPEGVVALASAYVNLFKMVQSAQSRAREAYDATKGAAPQAGGLAQALGVVNAPPGKSSAAKAVFSLIDPLFFPVSIYGVSYNRCRELLRKYVDAEAALLGPRGVAALALPSHATPDFSSEGAAMTQRRYLARDAATGDITIAAAPTPANPGGVEGDVSFQGAGYRPDAAPGSAPLTPAQQVAAAAAKPATQLPGTRLFSPDATPLPPVNVFTDATAEFEPPTPGNADAGSDAASSIYGEGSELDPFKGAEIPAPTSLANARRQGMLELAAGLTLPEGAVPTEPNTVERMEVDPEKDSPQIFSYAPSHALAMMTNKDYLIRSFGLPVANKDVQAAAARVVDHFAEETAGRTAASHAASVDVIVNRLRAIVHSHERAAAKAPHKFASAASREASDYRQAHFAKDVLARLESLDAPVVRTTHALIQRAAQVSLRQAIQAEYRGNARILSGSVDMKAAAGPGASPAAVADALFSPLHAGEAARRVSASKGLHEAHLPRTRAPARAVAAQREMELQRWLARLPAELESGLHSGAMGDMIRRRYNWVKGPYDSWAPRDAWTPKTDAQEAEDAANVAYTGQYAEEPEEDVGLDAHAAKFEEAAEEEREFVAIAESDDAEVAGKRSFFKRAASGGIAFDAAAYRAEDAATMKDFATLASKAGDAGKALQTLSDILRDTTRNLMTPVDDGLTKGGKRRARRALDDESDTLTESMSRRIAHWDPRKHDHIPHLEPQIDAQGRATGAVPYPTVDGAALAARSTARRAHVKALAAALETSEKRLTSMGPSALRRTLRRHTDGSIAPGRVYGSVSNLAAQLVAETEAAAKRGAPMA